MVRDAEIQSPGSIPASAGEPTPDESLARINAVYPRECGGTDLLAVKRHELNGLSPRVRGNRAVKEHRLMDKRSIPASAGEPIGSRAQTDTSGVYPRECGGTRPRRWKGGMDSGLSPRVRGNRSLTAQEREAARSIPASAGEPLLRERICRHDKVYPRECGGTSSSISSSRNVVGLSPRVRGNRGCLCYLFLVCRSIPASAGEPRQSYHHHKTPTVYPRECGGTIWVENNRQDAYGLSPRVRGNPSYRKGGRILSWSIPASAGEPMRCSLLSQFQWVYPRECGGTMCLSA